MENLLQPDRMNEETLSSGHAGSPSPNNPSCMPGSYVEASYKKIPKASNFPDYKNKEREMTVEKRNKISCPVLFHSSNERERLCVEVTG